MARAIPAATVRLPRRVVEELFDASLRVAGVVETLEVLMDKRTMRRIKMGEREYSARKYVFAKGPAQIRKALA